MPNEPPSPLARTSFSSLKQYLWCPEQWRRRRLLGHGEAPGWAQVAGKAVHELTDQWEHHHRVAPEEIFDWERAWGETFQRLILETVKDSGVLPDGFRVSGAVTKKYPDREDKTFWDAEGPRMARSWATWREANPGYQLWKTPQGAWASELEMTVDFGGTPLLAYVDRIMQLGDDLMVIDLKSGRHGEENTLQLHLYAAVIELACGVRPKLGAYFNCRKGELVYPETLDAVTTDDMVRVVQEFLAIAGDNVFLPQVGRHCTYCAYNADCQWAKTLTFGLRPR